MWLYRNTSASALVHGKILENGLGHRNMVVAAIRIYAALLSCFLDVNEMRRNLNEIQIKNVEKK